MRSNLKMASLIAQANHDHMPSTFPDELSNIVSEGWFESDCGALLLATLGRHAASWPCSDATLGRREYEINDVKVPDLDVAESIDRFLPEVAARGVTFAKAALFSARGYSAARHLAAVVSTGVDDDYLSHGTTVKFFTRRGDYPNWFDDLECFGVEAVAFLDFSDAAEWKVTDAGR